MLRAPACCTSGWELAYIGNIEQRLDSLLQLAAGQQLRRRRHWSRVILWRRPRLSKQLTWTVHTTLPEWLRTWHTSCASSRRAVTACLLVDNERTTSDAKLIYAEDERRSTDTVRATHTVANVPGNVHPEVLVQVARIDMCKTIDSRWVSVCRWSSWQHWQ